MKTELGNSFNKDLIYHFSMYAVAKKVGKSKPRENDIISLASANFDDGFLLDCLNKINFIINEIVSNKNAIFNNVIKRAESTTAVLDELANLKPFNFIEQNDQ